MTGRHAPKIEFPGRAEWAAVNRDEMAQWATRPDITPLASRVLFAALGRCDRDGHSPFAPGELRDVLGGVDAGTGEWTPCTRQGAWQAVQQAVRYGFVHPDSQVRYIILRPSVFQNGSGASKSCVHGKASMARSRFG